MLFNYAVLLFIIHYFATSHISYLAHHYRTHISPPLSPPVPPPPPYFEPSIYLGEYYFTFAGLLTAGALPIRFVLGSNGLLQVALGKSESDEYRPDLHLLSDRLKGQVGLFFTKLPREEVGDMAVVVVGCGGWERERATW